MYLFYVSSSVTSLIESPKAQNHSPRPPLEVVLCTGLSQMHLREVWKEGARWMLRSCSFCISAASSGLQGNVWCLGPGLWVLGNSLWGSRAAGTGHSRGSVVLGSPAAASDLGSCLTVAMAGWLWGQRFPDPRGGSSSLGIWFCVTLQAIPVTVSPRLHHLPPMVL